MQRDTSAADEIFTRQARAAAQNTRVMPKRPKSTATHQPALPVRRGGSFSDIAARVLVCTAGLALIGCADVPQIGGQGSPLLEARIDAALPPKAIDPDGALHFQSPEYSRRDQDLGLRR